MKAIIERPSSSTIRAKARLPRRKAFKAISLFSGGGGMDLGFAAAGYKLLCSTDIDPFSCETLRLNAGRRSFYTDHPVIQKTVTKLDANDLLQAARFPKEEVDLIIGGPPCQAFSVFGRRRGLEDPRGNLVWEYLRIVEQIKPQAFVFENVAGFKTIHDGGLYQDLLEALSIDGLYAVSDHNYQLADFGIPQFRDRIFFVGWKNGRRIPPMMPTHGSNDLFSSRPYATAGAALLGLPNPGPDSGIANHVGRDHSERIVLRYRRLQFGERDSKTRINKLHPDRPSFTIIVGSDAGGGKGHVHPFSPREVTPRESARIQTFPDWWEFSGTGRHVIRQVGNAVPPLFAAILAEYVRKHLFGESVTLSYEELAERIELDYLLK